MQFVEAHGCRIPQIGLGTMTLKEDVCVQAVSAATTAAIVSASSAGFVAGG